MCGCFSQLSCTVLKAVQFTQYYVFFYSLDSTSLASEYWCAQHREKTLHDWQVANLPESPLLGVPIPSVSPSLTISSKYDYLLKAFTFKYYHNKRIKQDTTYSIITNILHAYDNIPQSCYSYKNWVVFCIINVLARKFLKLLFCFFNYAVGKMLLSKDAFNIW